MRAALYARFSTDRQRDASIEDQFRECQRVARNEGLDVVARFEDRGVSGGTHQRSGYQRMLAAARNHEFDVIVAEDISRLWRSRSEFGPRSAELEDLGVHMLTCVGDDTRRDGWGLVVQIKQAVAEHARRESSYRTRRGLEGNALGGKPTGGRAYGYISARESKSGCIEIDEEEAAVVRRIFEMYSAGVAPRSIAATLNAEGIPSPGARWQRTTRRRDRKWLASAIHGDVKRGTGILNNRRYVAVVTWGRSEWKRSAADSKQRRHRILPAGSAHERTEERLRIVPQDLWDRVKTRQHQRTREIGGFVQQGLRKRNSGAGRPNKYLFSGLLMCGVCEASYVLRNRQSYCCASHWNGAACSNAINVPRRVVEEVLLRGIREDLTDPAVIAEFERRVHVAVRRQRAASDQGGRISALEAEVANLTDAIAGGMLRTSPALANRLAETERELARLLSSRRTQLAAVPFGDLRGRFGALVEQLDEVLKADPDRGREVLRGIFDGRVKLRPDSGGAFLWAEYSLGSAALIPNAEIMVAGAGFEPATFGL